MQDMQWDERVDAYGFGEVRNDAENVAVRPGLRILAGGKSVQQRCRFKQVEAGRKKDNNVCVINEPSQNMF